MTSRDLFLTFVLAKPFGVDLGKVTLVVDAVKKGAQADRLGVKAGWRLCGVGDHAVATFGDFAETMGALKKAGEKTCKVGIRLSSQVYMFFSSS
jgi:S1-C subfamily serine protease